MTSTQKSIMDLEHEYLEEKKALLKEKSLIELNKEPRIALKQIRYRNGSIGGEKK